MDKEITYEEIIANKENDNLEDATDEEIKEAVDKAYKEIDKMIEEEIKRPLTKEEEEELDEFDKIKTREDAAEFLKKYGSNYDGNWIF